MRATEGHMESELFVGVTVFALLALLAEARCQPGGIRQPPLRNRLAMVLSPLPFRATAEPSRAWARRSAHGAESAAPSRTSFAHRRSVSRMPTCSRCPRAEEESRLWPSTPRGLAMD